MRILKAIASGISAGFLAGMMLIPQAYEERGSWAVGGEWVLIIAIAAGMAYVAAKLDKWCCAEFRRTLTSKPVHLQQKR